MLLFQPLLASRWTSHFLPVLNQRVHLGGLRSKTKCRRDLRIRSIVLCTTEADETQVWNHNEDMVSTKGLLVSKADVEAVRSVGYVRIRRESTLGEVCIDDFGPTETKIDVAMVVTQYECDYKVIGRVRTKVIRVCDRCLKRYVVNAKGGFEVLLCTKRGRARAMEDEFEAVEDFIGATAAVEMNTHVHDAVRLSLPTKSLCHKGCKGIEIVDRDLKRSVGIRKMDSDNVIRDVQEKESNLLGQKLMELRDMMSRSDQT